MVAYLIKHIVTTAIIELRLRSMTTIIFALEFLIYRTNHALHTTASTRNSEDLSNHVSVLSRVLHHEAKWRHEAEELPLVMAVTALVPGYGGEKCHVPSRVTRLLSRLRPGYT